MTRRDLNVMDWRKAKTLSQLPAMVAKVLAVACFTLPGFTIFSSSALMVMTLSLLLYYSASLVFPPSLSHFVMDRAKIFRNLTASDSSWRIAASVRNGGRRTALHGFKYL